MPSTSRLWTTPRWAMELQRWLPARWQARLTSKSQVQILRTNSERDTEEEDTPRPVLLHHHAVRPDSPGARLRARLRADSASAAAAAGVDLPTYTLLMEIQHRDITPNDFDTLRLLDQAIKPKTLTKAQLDKHAPAWCAKCDGRDAASKTSCCICMEGLAAGERVRKLPCGHVFHASCLDQWLLECSDCCPQDGQLVIPPEKDAKEKKK